MGGALMGRHNAAERKVARVSPWIVRISRILGLSEEVMESLAGQLGMLHGILASDFAERFRDRDPYRVFSASSTTGGSWPGASR